MSGIQIKRAKEIQLKEMESYLQQNVNKVDAVAKEKEAGQNQKENRKAQKVRFYHSHGQFPAYVRKFIKHFFRRQPRRIKLRQIRRKRTFRK